MRDAQGSGELERLLAEHGGDLMRTAALLTGSRQDGEDLLQAALERLLRRGRRLDNPAGYLRRTLYNLAADGWRRQGAWRRKLVVIRASGPAAEADVMAAVDSGRADPGPAHASPQQRTVIVLVTGSSVGGRDGHRARLPEGTVKSAASRGLRRMRESASPWLNATIER